MRSGDAAFNRRGFLLQARIGRDENWANCHGFLRYGASSAPSSDCAARAPVQRARSASPNTRSFCARSSSPRPRIMTRLRRSSCATTTGRGASAGSRPGISTATMRPWESRWTRVTRPITVPSSPRTSAPVAACGNGSASAIVGVASARARTIIRSIGVHAPTPARLLISLGALQTPGPRERSRACPLSRDRRYERRRQAADGRPANPVRSGRKQP